MTTTPTTTPTAIIPRCRRCGKQHRTWWRLARCLWPRAVWITGPGGPYASVSECLPGCTVELWPTREKAEEAKRFIDICRCGGRCGGRYYHRVVDLAGGRPERRATP